MQIKKDLNNLRDCVKLALEEGCEQGLEFRKMRHALIIELKRLEYSSSEIKDRLLEWNKRCENPLPLSEQKIQLLGYVDWVDKLRECTIGCKALEDYCLGKDNCKFYQRVTCQNRKSTKDLPFSIQEVERFLTERYKADSYVMMLIVQALRSYQQEKATGQIILIGYRTISSIIRDKYGHNVSPMDVCRKMNNLINEQIIEKTTKGKAGQFRAQANGYRFLQWEHPV